MSTDVEQRLKLIEGREKRATKAPWEFWDRDDNQLIVKPVNRNDAKVICALGGLTEQTSNFKFIAESRADVPFLLALVRKYRETLNKSEAALGNSYDVVEWPGMDSQQGEVLTDVRSALAFNPEAKPTPAVCKSDDCPRCGKCDKAMTPENSRECPELFLCDECCGTPKPQRPKLAVVMVDNSTVCVPENVANELTRLRDKMRMIHRMLNNDIYV